MKIDVTELLLFLSERLESIVQKEENADHELFLFLPKCFKKGSFQGSLKLGIVL